MVGVEDWDVLNVALEKLWESNPDKYTDYVNTLSEIALKGYLENIRIDDQVSIVILS